MKVKELQEKLATLDPNLELWCYTEDEHLLKKDRGFLLFEIDTVDVTKAVKHRLDDGTPRSRPRGFASRGDGLG